MPWAWLRYITWKLYLFLFRGICVLFSMGSVALYNPVCMHKVTHVYWFPFPGMVQVALHARSAQLERLISSSCVTGSRHQEWGQATKAQDPSPLTHFLQWGLTSLPNLLQPSKLVLSVQIHDPLEDIHIETTMCVCTHIIKQRCLHNLEMYETQYIVYVKVLWWLILVLSLTGLGNNQEEVKQTPMYVCDSFQRWPGHEDSDLMNGLIFERFIIWIISRW